MDRSLVEKIVGKKHYVELNDEIFNLRTITYKIRENILFKIDFTDDFIDEIYSKVNNSYKIISNIIDGLESDKFTKGYTNSKVYLLKYLKNIYNNLNGMLDSINPINYDKILVYTNSLIDLILLF